MQTLPFSRARRALLLAMCAGLMVTTAPPDAKATAKTTKPRKPSTKIKFEKDSSETTAERERRLQRECRGRPNAGACLGYAR